MVGTSAVITQVIMNHLGDCVAKECIGVAIEERHELWHEFHMKLEGLKESVRSETAVPISLMDVKSCRQAYLPHCQD